MIISLGREFASGGREIGKKLAAHYGIQLLDKNILDELAKEKGFDVELLERLDEKPRNHIISRRVKGFSSSLEDIVAEVEFDYLKEKADRGESFVVVGRCAEAVLKGYKGLVSLFVLADMEAKKARVIEWGDATEETAEQYITRQNKRRKSYHNYHCTGSWGDSRNYDFCINSSRLGIDGTVDMLITYIDRYMKHIEE